MLNPEELARTRAELQANLALTGLTDNQVDADLGWPAGRLRATIDQTESSDPVDVWLLRDYLHQAVTDAGHTPVPFTILTRGNRVKAQLWFRLRHAPHHHFPAV